MLALFGRDKMIRNLYRLAILERDEHALDDLSAIRQAYLDFLDKRQRGVASNRHEDIFDIDPDVEEMLSTAFQKSELNDLKQESMVGNRYTDHEVHDKQILARRALVDLLALDSDFALVFALVIHSVFIRPSDITPGRPRSYGGSSSGSIGAIWLTIEDRLSVLDLQEMYVHELTHHLLFIDELNHPQFNYQEIAKPENYACSAILRRHRPLDKVVHSIVVATEILLARQRFLPYVPPTIVHPPTDALIKATLTAIASVDILPNRKDLMTPHLLAIIDTCRAVNEQHQETTHVCLESNV